MYEGVVPDYTGENVNADTFLAVLGGDAKEVQVGRIGKEQERQGVGRRACQSTRVNAETMSVVLGSDAKAVLVGRAGKEQGLQGEHD